MTCYAIRLSLIPQPLFPPSHSIFSTHTMLHIPAPPSTISSSMSDDATRLNMCCWGSASVSFIINGKPNHTTQSLNLQTENPSLYLFVLQPGSPCFYMPPSLTQVSHVTLAEPPSWSNQGQLSLRVLVACSAAPGQGASLVLVCVDGKELLSHNVTVEDGAVLPPCIAFTCLPSLLPSTSSATHLSRIPLLWIAGLGLDSLWMAFAFPISSSSSLPPKAAADGWLSSTVCVVRECAGLHLGAHSSSCTGRVRFSMSYIWCVMCDVT